MICDRALSDDDAIAKFMAGHARLAKTSRISTMTLTSRLVSCDMTILMERIRPTNPTKSPPTTTTDRLTCLPSAFCNHAFEITPFPTAFPGVRVRLFSTTGSLLITGCREPEQVIAALYDTCTFLGPCTCTFPVVRLINSTCSVGRTVSLGRAHDDVRRCVAVDRVTSPETQTRLVIRMKAGPTVQLFASGKMTVHANDFDLASDAIHEIQKFL